MASHAVALVRTAHGNFSAATRAQALRHWRFRPATRGGIAVASWQTKTVRFRITR